MLSQLYLLIIYKFNCEHLTHVTWQWVWFLDLWQPGWGSSMQMHETNSAGWVFQHHMSCSASSFPLVWFTNQWISSIPLLGSLFVPFSVTHIITRLLKNNCDTSEINSPTICWCLMKRQIVDMQHLRLTTLKASWPKTSFRVLLVQIAARSVCTAWGWCGNPWTRWGVWGNAPLFPSSASSSLSSSSWTYTLKTAMCWLVFLNLQWGLLRLSAHLEFLLMSERQM